MPRSKTAPAITAAVLHALQGQRTQELHRTIQGGSTAVRMHSRESGQEEITKSRSQIVKQKKHTITT